MAASICEAIRSRHCLQQKRRGRTAVGNKPCGRPRELDRRLLMPVSMRRASWLGLAAAILIGLQGAQAKDGLCPEDGVIPGTVASVNERLELTLESGLRLKIAGIDPPRPTPDDPGLDIRAQERLAQWLAGQKLLVLPAGPGVDRGGRTVAFVFAPAPGKADPAGKEFLPVGTSLIDAGLARYEPSAAARPCQSVLLAAEAGARAAGLGLWADPYYAVIAAADRSSFAEKAGTAVIVEGRITGIADRRPRIMLYFGPRQGWDFSVAVVPHSSKGFAAAQTALAGLIGRKVRVRGVLDTRFGPQIEISSPDEIEAVEEGKDSPAAPGTQAER